jgi:predicted RND superfamily exporter protein
LNRIAAFSLRHPALAVALALLATLTLGVGALRVGPETGYRAFLGDHHPAVLDLESVTSRFGGGVPFAIVFHCDADDPCHSVFEPQALAMAYALSTEIAKLPGVARVESPATSPLLAPELFDLPRARQLAPDGKVAPDVAELSQRALKDPTWIGQIISPDAHAGAIVVQLANSTSATTEHAVDGARAALASWEARGYRYSLVGGPVEFVVAGRELDRQVQRLVPAIVALVGVILLIAFRSVAPSALSLAAAGAALIWTIGVQGWLGWPRTSFFQVLPPLMLTLGVCYGIHVISSYAERLAEEPDEGAQLDRARREVILLRVIAEVGRPALYTAATTAAGFASFWNSGLESLVRFGWISAFGVMAAFGATFFLVPIALARMPVRWVAQPRSHAAWTRLVGSIADHVGRQRAGILIGTIVVVALSLVGMLRVSVDASFEEVYGDRSQVVRWAREAEALRGGDTLEVALLLPPGMSESSPEALRAVERIERMGTVPGIARPLSILTPMRELNALVHEDPLKLSGPAAQPDRPGQLLRLMRSAQPQIVALFAAAPQGASGAALRISFQGEKLPQDELRALVERVRREAEEAAPPGARVVVTGPIAVVSEMIDEIRDTQIGSFGSAVAMVFVLTALCLRSIPLALLAMIPTTVPVFLTLGAMGFLRIPLDMGTAMVASVLLGLGVDEALHLLTGYQRFRAAGIDRPRAMDASLREVGRALFTTAGALAAGFLVLFFVPWKSLSSFGVVTGVAVGASLLADLLLLPAALGSRAPAPGEALLLHPPETSL